MHPDNVSVLQSTHLIVYAETFVILMPEFAKVTE